MNSEQMHIGQYFWKHCKQMENNIQTQMYSIIDAFPFVSCRADSKEDRSAGKTRSREKPPG